MSAQPSKRTLKRLIGDLKLIRKEKPEHIDAIPDQHNMLKWYFIVKGPKGTVYEGGYYLGQIQHDKEYPMKAPSLIMLTPSGRFNTNDKICLSNTGWHQESWSPMWTIVAMLEGFLSIMTDNKEHGVAHIKRTDAERVALAQQSIEYNKRNYPDIVRMFPRFLTEDGDPVPETTETDGSKPKPKKAVEAEQEAPQEPADNPEPEPKPAPKKRGRPKKVVKTEDTEEPKPAPKKRGRPRKKPVAE